MPLKRIYLIYLFSAYSEVITLSFTGKRHSIVVNSVVRVEWSNSLVSRYHEWRSQETSTKMEDLTGALMQNLY